MRSKSTGAPAARRGARRGEHHEHRGHRGHRAHRGLWPPRTAKAERTARTTRGPRERTRPPAVPARTKPIPTLEARPGARATLRRRRTIMLQVVAIGLWCVLLFEALIDPVRRLEVAAAGRIMALFAGSDRISTSLGSGFIIFPSDGPPMIANMTRSCSTLASVVALSALAITVLRGRRGHTFLAFLAAACFVIVANQARLVLSLLAGALVGEGALLLFHDWVGAVFTFTYTLAGLILMIGLTMMNSERAEQDRTGRHTAGRPAGWARPGLGYRTGRLDRASRPSRRTLIGFVYRRLLPGRVSRKLAARRERGRVDYRIGGLSAGARAGALVELAAPGLGVHTATLVAAITHETDPYVLDPLARAIAAQQWEPVSDPQITALRLWARGWLMRASSAADPGVGADGSGTGSVLTATTSAVAPALITLAAVDGGLPPVNGKAAATPPMHTTPVGTPPATPLTGQVIAVTGAGGPAGVSVIRALLAAGHPVLALDSDPDAIGLRLATGAAVLLRGDDPRFGEAVLRVVSEARPAALISTLVEEYDALTDMGATLEALGCRTWLPEPKAVHLCADKAAFGRAMAEAGLPHPPTASTYREARSLPGPWIVKPARGRGSRHVVRADRRADLKRAFATVPRPVAQSRLTGKEFTADVLIARDGAPLVCVPRWRDEVKAGISVRGETFDSPTVTAIVLATMRAVGLTGPANVQGFVDSDGMVTVVEVNPRFSGGLPLTLAAGADVVGTYLTGIVDPGAVLPRLSFQPGVRMSRCFAERYQDEHGRTVDDPLDRDARLLMLAVAALRSDPPGSAATEIEPVLAALAERLGGGPARPPLPATPMAPVP